MADSTATADTAAAGADGRMDRGGGIGTFVAAVVAGMFISVFVVGSVRVGGASMQPSLHDGDRAIVLRLDAWLHRLGVGRFPAGAIVFFPDPTVEPKPWRPWLDRHLLIKRIVAGPGDRVSVQAGRLLVNGEARPEPYLEGVFRGRSTLPELVLREGEVYVLGDNRAPLASRDSRSFGAVASASLAGRALLVFWPLFRRTPDGWRWNPHILLGHASG